MMQSPATSVDLLTAGFVRLDLVLGGNILLVELLIQPRRG
jgi:hypothetical protein